MNWHFSYRKTAIFLFLVFVGIFCFIYFTGSAVAISRIDISSNQLQVGDTVEATAHFSDWEQIASVDVVVDGVVVLTCQSAPTCSMSHILFPEEIGDHEYVFVVTDKKGKKTSSGGKYGVVTDAPEITSLTTNNTTFPVGGALYVQADAKSESPITSAKVYVDGELKQYCLAVPCIAAVGPFTGDDEGQHAYSIIITNKKGKTVTPGGMFTVLPANPVNDNEKPPVLSTPELVEFHISKPKPVSGEMTTVTVGAKDEKGIASIIIFYDKKNVGGCTDKNTCSLTIGPFSDAEVGPHAIDVLVINKDGKKIEVAGGIVVSKKEQAGSGAANAAAVNPQPKGQNQGQQSAPAAGQQNSGSQPAQGNAGAANLPQPVGGAAQPPANGNVPPAPAQGSGTPVATSTPKVQPSGVQPQNTIVPEASAPQLVYIISQGNQLYIGDTVSVNILVKDEKGIDVITAYVDGKVVATCMKLVVCSFKKGPLTDSDLGSHTYSFLVKNLAGKTIQPGGGFSVSKPVGATVPSGLAPVLDATLPSNNFEQQIKNLPKEVPDMVSLPGIENIKKEPLWIDTDGGIKEYTVGKCVSNVKNASYQKSIQDYCVDKKQLVEFYVEGAADKCMSKQITCGGACYEGQCYIVGSRPGAGYTPPTRPGAGYEPPSRPGVGYEPISEPLSRPNTGHTPPAEPLWIDTDGGINKDILGQCVSNVKDALFQKSLSDVCIDKKQLTEYYVDEKAEKCLSKQLTCENLCYGGVCYASGTRPGVPAYNPASYYEEPSRPTYEAPSSATPSRPTYEVAPTPIPARTPSRPTYEAPAVPSSR